MNILCRQTKEKFALCFFPILLLLTVSLFPQKDNIRFKRISIEQGLSQVSVFCILQDQKKFMWFGTQDGLNRYDGYEFKIYRHVPDDPATISDNRIECIYEASSGIIWIGTDGGGLNKLDPKTGVITHYTTKNSELSHDKVMSICEDKYGTLWVGTEGGGLIVFEPNIELFKSYTTETGSLSNDWVTSIFEDRTGMLWIGTEGGGLNRFDPKSGVFTHYTTQNSRLSHDKVMCIYEDRAGVLWSGTEGGGLNKFDPKTGDFTHYKTDNSKLSHDEVRALHESHNGILWVGTRGGGLYAFNRTTGVFTHYKHEATPHSLSHNDIRSIYEDESGILWVGTRGKGLNVYAPTTAYFEHFTNDTSNENSLSHNTVLSFCEDETGEIWIGTHGGGLNKFNRKTGKFTRYTDPTKNKNRLSSKVVWSIYKDKVGELWIGTYGGGLNKYDRKKNQFKNYTTKDGLSHNDVRTIYEDRFGEFWIGTDGKGLNLFDRKAEKFIIYRHISNDPDSLSNDRVLSIKEDSSGELWIGTRNGGLNRLINREDRKKMKFTAYRNNPDIPESLSHNGVNFIYEDSSEVLWLGTSGGLNKMLDKERGIFKPYREKDGLSNDTINAILEDKEGNLWLSTNKGLSKFDPKTETFRNFYIEDGIQSNEFNGASCFKTKTGEMFFGGVNGFNIFSPGAVKEDPYVPPVVITNFFISNKPVTVQSRGKNSPLKKLIHETKSLMLPYRDNVFSFEFAALHYAGPAKNKYRYKLEGWDDNWIPTDAKNRRVTYTNLPGGDYVFRVKGSNKDGKWNEKGTSLKLKIESPPWKTWWAYSLYAIAVIGVLFLLFFVWDQRKKAVYEHQLNQRLKEVDKLKDEFLSNTSHELKTPLNGIIGLTESLLDGAAGPVDGKLADDLSMVVTSGKRLANLVNDILDFSRLRDKDLKLTISPVGLHPLTDIVITLFRPIIRGKNLELVNSVGRDIPLVPADENRLQQIMLNLVGNAVKFTESGRVEVTAEVKNDMLHVHVTDTGIGIPEEKFEEIFESFEQAEGSAARPYGGTGLGLAITKKLVELHGGKIWVKSTVGKGTTFTFTFSLSTEVTERPGPKSSAEKLPVFEAPGPEAVKEEPCFEEDTRVTGTSRILVVDDHEVNRRVIVNFLDLQNYTVSEAPGGHEALKALECGPHFDLVLLDIMMPRMSGYEVCRKIRERFSAHDLPVIFITAKDQPSDKIAGFDSGGTDFVTKPVDKDELSARIRAHIQLKNTRYQLIQNEKMASLGRLVSGVSHELNNPAAVLMLNSEFFAKAWKDIVPILDKPDHSNKEIIIAGVPFRKSKGEIDKLITGLLDHSQRIKKIIQNLKNFSKKEDVPEKKEIDINEVVRNSIDLTRAMIDNSTKHFSPPGLEKDLPGYYGSFQELQQVFIALIENACRALPDDTRGIHISTRFDKEKKEIVVDLKDEGIGIEEDDKAYIMEPFFSTWRELGCTGLGMYTSYQIIKEQHGGELSFESLPGKGTTFSVHLPLEGFRIDKH